MMFDSNMLDGKKQSSKKYALEIKSFYDKINIKYQIELNDLQPHFTIRWLSYWFIRYASHSTDSTFGIGVSLKNPVQENSGRGFSKAITKRG